MKKTLNHLSALIAISAFTFILTSCGQGSTEQGTETATEQAAVVDTTHAYICPMHCENSARMEPGVCAVCGMDLVRNPDYKAREGNMDDMLQEGDAAASDSTQMDMTETHDEESGEGHENHMH